MSARNSLPVKKDIAIASFRSRETHLISSIVNTELLLKNLSHFVNVRTYNVEFVKVSYSNISVV